MKFTLPDLPYPVDALAPVMSEDTLRTHHSAHHAGYVRKLNKLLDETGKPADSLELLVRESKGNLFNFAAQAWNHEFFWESMAPDASSPGPQLTQALDEHFGDLEKFQADFREAAVGVFGSGWTWLVLDGDRLAIEPTVNADNPLRHGRTPLLTLDVWEHAYYLDYRNKRGSYVDAWWKIVNWKRVEERLAASHQVPVS